MCNLILILVILVTSDFFTVMSGVPDSSKSSFVLFRIALVQKWTESKSETTIITIYTTYSYVLTAP